MHNVWMDQAEDIGRETEELAESPKRFPVYRLTKWVHHPQEIDGWLKHFDTLNRNAGILLFDYQFSVWVQGKEYVGPPDVPNSEPPKGIPVNWVGDFLIFYPHPKIGDKHG